MSTTTTETRCWELIYTKREESHHFPTRADAEKFRDSFANVETALRRVDHLCHTITCSADGCGYRFDEGDEITHFTSPEEAVRWVLLCGWVDSEGGPVCQGCVEDGRYPLRL